MTYDTDKGKCAYGSIIGSVVAAINLPVLMNQRHLIPIFVYISRHHSLSDQEVVVQRYAYLQWVFCGHAVGLTVLTDQF